jgi:hypothetical protein
MFVHRGEGLSVWVFECLSVLGGEFGLNSNDGKEVPSAKGLALPILMLGLRYIVGE